ncbi:bacteriocin-like protein [Chryseobacterium daeguense]|uniref:bacteriocin-like protein n=1 Tax=Chryseobacterium daeguense TaxID=412438 RepID=UPI000427B2DB|nr:hypothetical protein [Chryseobacterium daeguense]
MRKLSKLSREQLKTIAGNGLIKDCSNKCCPDDGRPRCPGLICTTVICPKFL